MSDYFKITYLCDVSKQALEHCSRKVAASPPKTTSDAADVCSSPDVDVVFVINSTPYHTPHAVLALQNNKTVFIEKPMVMNERDAAIIVEAEKASKATVMVGYMRRYAEAFVDGEHGEDSSGQSLRLIRSGAGDWRYGSNLICEGKR